MSDTIYALASGIGPAGIAVVRVSGPRAGVAMSALVPSLASHAPPPRQAVRATLFESESTVAIDDGMLIWFPGPASFTGEDVVEFHVHGGLAVVDELVRALAGIDGLRPAEAGEFTRRAFENGKMDLTAAEGLADLVSAETEQQRRQALRQLRGELGELCGRWAAALTTGLAHMEAAIDFSDEDLPEGLAAMALETATGIEQEIRRQLADGHRGERIRQGFRIAIIGAPNAGKSTLLNRLARRDAAIVSATAGTTRDVIEVHLDIGGFAVVMVDTAGLRQGGDEIEREGMRRTALNAENAELRLAVVDAANYPDVDAETLALVESGDIVAFNKIDLVPMDGTADTTLKGLSAISICSLSALDGAGLADLEALIAERIGTAPAGHEAPPLTRERHRRALEECRDALVRARLSLESERAAEFVAEDLRLAVRALGRVTGRVDVEDLLDIIFGEFCIGK